MTSTVFIVTATRCANEMPLPDRSVKTISWNSDARTLVKKNIPSQFQTTSKVAIVANEWQQSNKDVLA